MTTRRDRRLRRKLAVTSVLFSRLKSSRARGYATLRAGLPAVACAAALALFASSWVSAQQQPPVGAPAAPRAQPKAAPKAPAAGAPATDSQLRQRVEQLEEQLVDMQVLVGTLESLARGGGAPARTGGSSGASDAARIDALETQIRAMTMQIEELSRQVRQRQGRMEESAPPVREGALPPPASQGFAAAPPAAPGGFGSMTVTPQSGGDDRIGQMISATPGPVEGGRLPPAVSDASSAKELYETAYGYLLQQDYAAAEAAFDEFLSRYPNDHLTADAQYWLGETLFVQRRYKPAGQAFLRVMQNHRQSSKAPNSLLMLAMTLEQLGQKDCALFTELETRHANAPQDIKTRARVVKQRVGC
jgi:tol-pal system protein YbgF